MKEKTLRVLLACDEVGLRESLARRLRDEYGCQVDAATDAGEAWRLAAETERPYDVVLIDDLLAPGPGAEPESVGIDLMCRVKERYPEVECIILAGWGTDRALEALQAGAYWCLAKPLNIDELGMAIRMAAERRQLKQQLKKLQWLSQASNEMMSNLQALSLTGRLNMIVRHAAQILDAEASSILLVQRPGVLVKEACYGHIEGEFQKGREFPIRSGRKTGLTGHIAYVGELFNAHGDALVGHWATTGKPPNHILSGKCCSLLAIPLKRRSGDTEELVGLLEVENKKDADGQPKSYIGFTEEDEWILTIFAETVVTCLENAELYDRTSDRLEKKMISLKAIQETGAAISAELDLDELLELISKNAAKVFAAPAASLMLWDDRKENLVVKAKYGLTDEYTNQFISREKVDAAIALMGGLRLPPTVDLRRAPFGRLDLIEAEHLCSVLSTPLVASDELIGVLDIYSKDDTHQFTSDEIEVADVFASQAAVAIRNAQLYEQLQRRANVLQALYDAGRTITASLELDTILNQLVLQAQRLTGKYKEEAYFGDILLVDGRRLRFASAFPEGLLDDLRSRFGSHVDLDKGINGRTGITGRAALTGQSQLVGDVTKDPDFYQACSGQTLSELAVPIKMGGEVIGVINVEHPDLNAFDEEDQRALESLAPQAAVAIQNARQFRLREELLKAGEVATAKGELYPALEVIAQSLKEMIGCDVVCLYTYDEKKRVISYPSVVVGELRKPQERAVWELVSQERKLPVDLLGERSVIKKLLEYGASRFANCSAKDSILRAGRFVAREGIESSAGILLKVGEEVVGILFVNYRSTHHFREEEKQAAELFAYHAAVAIRNAQLHEEAIRRANALEALCEAGKAVTSTLALNEILSRIAEQAWWLTGHYDQEIHLTDLELVEGNELKLKAAYPPAHIAELQRIVGDIDLGNNGRIGVTGRAARTGQSQLVANVTQDPDYIEYLPETRSELAVPIKLGKEVIGIINVEHTRVDAFDGQDQQALEALAAQAAIAIENARHFEDLKKIRGYIGSKTAVDWIRMVSTAWGHSIRREVGTALGRIALLRGLLARVESVQKTNKELDQLENVIRGIKEIPIIAPLSYEDAVGSVQINDLVKTHLERQWNHVRYKSIELCLDLQESLDSIVTVRVGREWLRRAIEMLTDNSVQAMLEADSSEKRVTVATRVVGKMVEISVRDTGPGIPQHVLGKLFKEPIDKPVRSRGAGIGLILAQTIVQTYGGDIHVEPPGEGGTNMVIALPIES
jgi:GAF domain-containing protein/CheY-like chemotaxis protein